MDSQEEKPIKDDNSEENELRSIAIGSISVGGDISGNITVGQGNLIYLNPKERPADIFISYARTDVEIV